MPGIYGLYVKDNLMEKKEIEHLFASMDKLLCHRNDYVTAEYTCDNFLIGKKSFNFDPEKNIRIKVIDNSYVIFFDGGIFSYQDGKGRHEVYNYDEYITYVIERYRTDKHFSIEDVVGEFIIGLYDIKNKELIIANDMLGFRELYYYSDERICIFSSEAKAVLLYKGIKRKTDDQAISDFMRFGYILGNRTFIEGIYLLPPNTKLNFRQDGCTIESSDLTYGQTLQEDSFDNYVDTAYSLIDQAVNRRLRGRKNVASYLSGGLDSRLITGISSKHAAHVDTYSIGYNKRGKEFLIAQKISNKLPNVTNRLAQTSPDHVINYLQWAVWISDGMISLSSISPLFGSVVNHMKDHDILLGGCGGNILGALFTKEQYISKDLSISERIKILSSISETQYIKQFEEILFPKTFIEKYRYYSERSVKEQFEYLARGINLFSDQLDLFVVLNRYRRNFNTYRGLLGHIVTEEYYPFFDNDLLSYFYSIPKEFVMNYRLYKELYMKYFPELAGVVWLLTGKTLYEEEHLWEKQLNDLIQRTKSYLTAHSKGKINFMDQSHYAAHDYWYRTDKKFQNYINGILLDPRTYERGYVTEKGLRAILDKTKDGSNCFPLIDRIIVFELWCRIFLDGESSEEFHCQQSI
jgi:asparagine synthase (glutamine-hydrolysing)